jgi:hypothetical protein
MQAKDGRYGTPSVAAKDSSCQPVHGRKTGSFPPSARPVVLFFPNQLMIILTHRRFPNKQLTCCAQWQLSYYSLNFQWNSFRLISHGAKIKSALIERAKKVKLLFAVNYFYANLPYFMLDFYQKIIIFNSSQ